MVCLRAGRRHQYDLLCDDHLTELSSSRCVHQYEPEGKCVWLLIACHLHKKGGHLPDAHAVVSGHRGADCVCGWKGDCQFDEYRLRFLDGGSAWNLQQYRRNHDKPAERISGGRLLHYQSESGGWQTEARAFGVPLGALH